MEGPFVFLKIHSGNASQLTYGKQDCGVKRPFDFLIPELFAKELLLQFC